jgi:transcriptional regulator with XRE-family HTH domain
MNLAEKIKHLRGIEGELRGLNRPMTQMEVVRTMQEELGESISQAYLSQLEKSKRLHLTASSRDLLSRFFKVHPGYLVSDPPDYNTELYSADLLSEVQQENDRLETWLIANSAEWRSDTIVSDLLRQLADTREPHRYLEVFERLMALSIEELEAIANALFEPQEEPNLSDESSLPG